MRLSPLCLLPPLPHPPSPLSSPSYVARLANWLIPTWPVVATNKNTMFPQLQADWDASPVTYHYQLRARVGVECMAACADAVAGLGGMRVPFLVAHSARDTMCDPEGSRMLLEAAQVRWDVWRAGGRKRKEARTVG